MDLGVDPTLVLLLVSGGLLSLVLVLCLLRSEANPKKQLRWCLGQQWWWTDEGLLWMSSLSERKKVLCFPPQAEVAWVCSCQVEIF